MQQTKHAHLTVYRATAAQNIRIRRNNYAHLIKTHVSEQSRINPIRIRPTSDMPEERVEAFNRYFSDTPRNWRKQRETIQKYLDKADIVPMDLHYLSEENKDKLKAYALSLPQRQRDKVIFVTGVE